MFLSMFGKSADLRYTKRQVKTSKNADCNLTITRYTDGNAFLRDKGCDF